MATTHRYERTEFLAYAMYNIAASSNEDRCATFASHEREGMPSMASFGVFDGHMGSTAAEACSTQLHGMVALNARQLSNVIVSKSNQGAGVLSSPSPPPFHGFAHRPARCCPPPTHRTSGDAAVAAGRIHMRFGGPCDAPGVSEQRGT